MKDNDKLGSTGVRFLEIDENRTGQRLDNFLIGQLKGVPKSRIYRLVRKGEVRVNRGRVQPDYRLQTGDSVRLPPIRLDPPPTSLIKAENFEWLNERLLYEDDDFIALNKPSGLAVHSGSGVQTGLIEAWRSVRAHTPMLELAHRLDRETSGCILIAKRRPALLKIHEMLRKGTVQKRYQALIQGCWQGGTRIVHAPLARDRIQEGGERWVGISEEGKEAESRFKPLQAYSNASLVEIDLKTGRTHQARVHSAYLGHPIAGDDKYGNRNFNREMRALGLKRLFLHAAELHLIHPQSGRPLHIKAPLPADLLHVLGQLNGKTPV